MSVFSPRSPLHDAAQDTDGPTRVVIVDDHALLRAGTRQILDSDGSMAVVGEASDGISALSVVDETRPDVVLVDIRLPDGNGIDLARRIASGHPQTTVVILSAYDDDDYVQAAIGAGVSGYLLKTMPGEELVRAIRAARSGTTVLDPAVTARLANPRQPRPANRETSGPESLSAAPAGAEGLTEAAGPTAATAATAAAGLASLTWREREVAAFVAEGLANKAIASKLGISIRTVEGHLSHIFTKLDITSRTELVRFAIASGLTVAGMHAERGSREP